MLPPLVKYNTKEEYKSHFEKIYCNSLVTTFDEIKVRFRKKDFEHCFYESSKRNGEKDVFSEVRAERIDWIKAVLENPDADLRIGWDKKKKRYNKKRRVAIVVRNYVVVIALKSNNKEAVFYYCISC